VKKGCNYNLTHRDRFCEVADYDGIFGPENCRGSVEWVALQGLFHENEVCAAVTGLLRSLQAGTTLVLCSTFLACIGATTLPKRTRTPEGTELKNVDLTFIHPGQTTRDEVREKLKLIDTGYQGDFFSRALVVFYLGRMDGRGGNSPGWTWRRGKSMEERQPAGGIR
jgi:hypothetical protein